MLSFSSSLKYDHETVTRYLPQQVSAEDQEVTLNTHSWHICTIDVLDIYYIYYRFLKALYVSVSD